MASATTNNSTSSSSSSTSPRLTSENNGSPTASASQSSRPSRQVSSPWSQIVRGESELIASASASSSSQSKAPIPSAPSSSPSKSPMASSSSSSQSKAPIEPNLSVSAAPSASLAAREENSERSGGQGNSGKKPVWTRPSKASDVGPVMGASSWPALSESTKAPSNKLSISESSSSSSSSVPVSQGIANAPVPLPVPVPAPIPAPRQVGSTTPNNSRQRSFNRNGPSGSVNGIVSQPSAQGSFAELPSHNPSPRGQNQRNGFASQAYGGTDNLSQRDSNRNHNGHHHQSHGGRRNQEHRNQNWNSHRNFNGRDGNAHTQRHIPAFVRHAPPPPPPPVQPIPPHFMAAQPFGPPVPFRPELAMPYYPRLPFIAPLAPVPTFYHVQDHPLNIRIQNQIHYYFSDDNLGRDGYLRRQMDDQGFVPLHLIAGFKKIVELTDSIPQIVEALRDSSVVEVQGDGIRKRDNWQHYVKRPVVPSPQSAERTDGVASRIGNLSLGESSTDPVGGSSSQLEPGEPENVDLDDGQQQSSGVDTGSNRNDSDGATR